MSVLALSACSKNNPAPETENSPVSAAPASSAQETAQPTGDTAESSLDWAGEYEGIFPCADCEGIEVELKLKPDYSYELSEKYLGKGSENKFKTAGSFSFDTHNSSVITLDQNAEKRKFFIGENFAEARDKETGQAIETTLNYKLSKSID